MPSTAPTGAAGRRTGAQLGRTAVAGLAGGELEVAAVGVDVLAEQGDLGDAVGGERSTSATMSAKGRLISAPRTAGTMQNAQLLSQPIWMVTQARSSTSRGRQRRREHRRASSITAASRISTTGPRPSGPREQLGGAVHVVGADHHVDVGARCG
jgi:hypothetical protein